MFDAVVKAGHHQQRQQGRRDGAADDRYRHRPIELAAFTDADGHRQHARDQRKRRHQDRPQPLAAGRHQRFFTLDTLALHRPRRVEQQDRVFGHQPHQHDDADEAHQVQRAARDQQGQHDADQAQRQRQHHRQRRRERAELHDQDQVHQRDARDQRNRHFAEQLLLVLRRASQLQPEARWVVHCARNAHRFGGDLARRAALHVGRYADRALATGVLDLARPFAHRHGGDLLQRHHAVAAADRDRQPFDVAGRNAVVGVQAHRHVAGFAAGVDPVADFNTGKGHPQRLRRVGDADAQGVGQAAVELDLQFVLRVLLGQADIDRARHQAQLVHELVGDLQQPPRVGAGEADLHRLLGAVVEVVENHVFGTHQPRGELAQVFGNRLGRTLTLGALADVNVDPAAAGIDVAVGGLGLGHRARQRGNGLDLQL